MFERNIGTVLLLSTCQRRIPDWIKACSNVNEHPKAKATKSGRHLVVMSSVVSASTPSR